MNGDSNERKIQNSFYCTTRMLRDVCVMDDKAVYKSLVVGNVFVVARVKDIVETSLRYEYVIEDMSGTFRVFTYKKISAAKDGSIGNGIKALAYAQISGSFRKIGDDSSFITSSIIPVSSRTQVNHFYSLVILSNLKNFPDTRQSSKSDQVLKALSKLPFKSHGYTSSEILAKLEVRLSASELDTILINLTSSNKLANGVDWNHYKLKP